MHFIYPGFLFALLALAIPIIIHLFNFRRFKKVYFTNVRFLREIRQDTQSRSRLKHLLILLSRLLAVAFLVFAFAQPYLPLTNTKIEGGVKKISIYVDNSFSMDAVGKNGNLLETAKKKAREIAMAFKPSDRFQLLTSDFEAKHQRLLNREEFLQAVDEIKPGPSARLLSEVLQRQEAALADKNEKEQQQSFIISDFQKSITDEGFRADSTIKISLVPVEASVQNNIYIDTCFLSTPFVQLNTPAELTVIVRNKGNSNAENIPIKLSINGIQKAIASTSIPEGSYSEAKLSFTLTEPGWQQAALSITDYPVTFDDNFYFSFNVRKNLDILCINGKESSSSINAVFSDDEYFHLHNNPAGQIDYSAFPSSQLIILNEIPSFSSGMLQELKKYVLNGGTLFLIPSEDADIKSYNELADDLGFDRFSQFVTMEDKVVSIEEKNELFVNVFEKGKGVPENLDLPVVNRYYNFVRRNNSNTRSVMRLRSGNTFLLAASYSRGKVYAIASSLQSESGSFPRHALFVPVFLRAALQGSSEISAPLVIGRDHDFIIKDTLVSNDNIFHLTNKDLKFDVIPESRLLNSNTVISVHDQVTSAQNYELTATGKLLATVAFNYDRKESDLQVMTKSDLEKIASLPGIANMTVIDAEGKDLSHSITQLNEGRRLWKYCIIASLLFLALEVLLIRYFHRLTPQAK
jgi:hypothetical protein